ncbi:unnamed protein product [Ranitomeya imitator]|uniref:COP9 signalosome complex subunit 7 helix I domain-containing protein n=1 Tax=Ranitomeya imitator TaxID=111125 RepID=A0ABN9L0Y2_9NEOB|nr:unnamed protein product [Ranitomeya imitator]
MVGTAPCGKVTLYCTLHGKQLRTRSGKIAAVPQSGEMGVNPFTRSAGTRSFHDAYAASWVGMAPTFMTQRMRQRCDGCEAVLMGIEQQVLRANQYKENHIRTQQQIETEVTNIKKTLKATASSTAQDTDQHLAEREGPPLTEQRQPTKKMSKVKGLVSSRH